MTKVLIIGATGSVGRVVVPELLKETTATLVLASRHPQQVAIEDPARESAVKLNVTNDQELATALTGVDFVLASLSGRMRSYAKHLVKMMDQVGLKRLVFITTMGIYREIPSWLGHSPNPYFNPILRPYRRAADVIEQSDLDYTILRPGWYDDGPAEYELTKKGEPFGGHDVSRFAIADLVAKMVNDPQFGVRQSYGINRPEAH